MRRGNSFMAERKFAAMKTSTFLTNTFVSEKTRKRAQQVNFLKAGRESTAKVVSANDLFKQSTLSQG